MAVELNIVMIVSSIPFLRPLFQRNHQANDNKTTRPRYELGSVFSKNGGGSGLTELSHPGESQENLSPVKHASTASSTTEGVGITVTSEVTVTYSKLDVPFVHAALVGLVQGEINRRTPVRTDNV